MAREFQHLIRLGTHAEQDYVFKGARFFDSLVLNANLVEGTTGAISVLATRLGKPYFIDPVSYAFALDPRLLLSQGARGHSAPKRTFAALANSYGLPAELVGVAPLRPSDVRATPGVGELTLRVLKYQESTVREVLEEDLAFRLSDVARDGSISAPTRLIPPYFVEDFGSGWDEVNRASALEAVRRSDLPLAVSIAVDSRLLTSARATQVAAQYADVPIDTAFLWLTDLDEHISAEPLLADYVRIVELLSRQDKGVIASYGGFFSLLLAFRGMTGSTHGIGYGDKRNLEPVVGGGLPPARYYLPALRDSISLGDLPLIASGMSTDEFRKQVCGCTICAGLVSKGGVEGLVADFTETEDRRTATGRVVAIATARVHRMARFHFLEARAQEFTWIREVSDLDEVLAKLRSDSEWVRDRLGRSATSHLARWISVLQE